MTPMSLNESTADSEPFDMSVIRRESVVKLIVSALASMSRAFATVPQRDACFEDRPRLRESPAVVFARSWVVVTAALACEIEM